MSSKFQLLEDDIINKEYYQTLLKENDGINLVCSICLGILLEPYNCTGCQNSLCKKCKDDWLQKKQSNSCVFKCKGGKYIPNRLILPHLKKLKFKCQNNCNIEIEYIDVEEHYKNKCPKLPKNQFDRTELINDLEKLNEENRNLKEESKKLKSEQKESEKKINNLEKENKLLNEKNSYLINEISKLKEAVNKYLHSQKEASKKLKSLLEENNNQNFSNNINNINNDEEENKDKSKNNLDNKKAIRCKFGKKCTNNNCKFLHPEDPCPFYPDCMAGVDCIYQHPK